jgi:hypothetical protein
MTASAGTSASPSIHFSSDTNTGIFSPAADTIAFAEGGAEAMRIDSSGNVGIGTTSPSAQVHVYKNAGSAAQITIENASSSAGSYGTLQFNAGTVTSQLFSDAAAGVYAAGAVLRTTSNHPLIFGTNNTERARIDSSGNLLVGTTTDSGSRVTASIDNASWTYTSNQTGSGTFYHMVFRVSGTSVGSIQSSSTTTTYNTSSDYRLKNTIAPMTGALAKVALLKPCTYKWNIDGSDGQGFIAHELAQVVPDCVTGEKDAIDADGKPQYQGVDTSFLVATLTAAIQELKAELDTVKAQNAAFEARLAALEAK